MQILIIMNIYYNVIYTFYFKQKHMHFYLKCFYKTFLKNIILYVNLNLS